MTVREIVKWLAPDDEGEIEIVWKDKLYAIDKDDDFIMSLYGDFLIESVHPVSDGFEIELKTATAKPLKAGDVV